MIIDAGGGTVDISSYKFVDTAPMTVEEISPAECEKRFHPDYTQDLHYHTFLIQGVLHGSTRVNIRAHEFLQGQIYFLRTNSPLIAICIAKLRNSKYGNEEDLYTMLENFERSTKPTFKDPTDKSFIRFGSMRDKDPDFGIRGGQISIEG